MKRIIAVLCAATLLLCGLTACEDKNTGDASSEVFTNNAYEPIKRAEIKYEEIGEPSVKPENTYKSGIRKLKGKSVKNLIGTLCTSIIGFL